YRGIDSLIFVSEAARETFLSTSPGVDESRISVIHNAVRIPVAAHSDAGSHEEVTLAFIGRISPEKGLDVLLEALCSLGDVPLRLLVAGTGKGTDVMPLVRMSRRSALSGRVEWLGHVDDPLEVARRADIGIVPSVLAESFGLAIIEFMSCGVPVVATALGGPIEIITEGRDGLLVPASDPSALAAAIRRLATDRELCSRMGQEALATAGSRFAYEGFYRKIMNTYQS
ncbi:MAG: glycosyltransferase family 4 protein, partial [Muribaculaceae bacterium]|nr:glycosyltransferase family 4 protein [Muribaculaceae bacterium]